MSTQEDVILSCIDDPDISIRLQALDLVAGMVTSENLIAVVERLMHQLCSTPVSEAILDGQQSHVLQVEPAADSDGEDPEEVLRQRHEIREEQLALPTEYKTTIIRQLLEMCSKDTYVNISDFDWYIGILLQLIKVAPKERRTPNSAPMQHKDKNQNFQTETVSTTIGRELRNVTVRVNTVRKEAVKAANSLVAISRTEESLTAANSDTGSILSFAAWISGEYVRDCVDSQDLLDSLLRSGTYPLPPHVICAYVQAVPKVLAHMVSENKPAWNTERQTMTSLLVARIVRFLEPLTDHPDLDVQERAVEFLELMRVTYHAIVKQALDNAHEPLLLTKALPQFFSDTDLKPVAPTAQRKVPLPEKLDLDTPINKNLSTLLRFADEDLGISSGMVDFDSFYNQRPVQRAGVGHAFNSMSSDEIAISSYQERDESANDTESITGKQLERQERNKDDPFHLTGGEASSGASTPFHDILRHSNGENVDIDAIPIMDLDLGNQHLLGARSDFVARKRKKRRSKKLHIVQDETLNNEVFSMQQRQNPSMGFTHLPALVVTDRKKKSLLEVDSSGLDRLSLEGNGGNFEPPHSIEKEAGDLDMVKALAEVERLRLEMQRASERVQAADGAPAEGTLVKKKRKEPKQQRTRDSNHRAYERSHLDALSIESGSVLKRDKRTRSPAPALGVDTVLTESQ